MGGSIAQPALSQELLELPARFQAFVRVTEENNRLMRERLDRVESDIGDLKAGQAETNQRLGSVDVRDSSA